MRRRYRTLKDKVYAYLAEQIQQGKLRPGERVNEQDICEELGVSRTPVREAFISLTAEDVLENRIRKGFVVKPLSEKEAEDLFVLIGTLDAMAARLAFPYITDEDIQEMKEHTRRMDEAIESSDYSVHLENDAAFHQVYLDRCSNWAVVDGLLRSKRKLFKGPHPYDTTTKDQKVIRGINEDHKHMLELFQSGTADEIASFLAERHWHPDNAKYELLAGPEE